MERLARMERIQLCQHPTQALVTAWSRSAALDSEAKALADGVNVRQMDDAPATTLIGMDVILFKIAGRVHRRVGDCPDQRGRSHIGAHNHDAIGQCHDGEALRRAQDCKVA